MLEDVFKRARGFMITGGEGIIGQIEPKK